MNREQKAAAIREVAGDIRDSEAIFAVDYRGLSVKQSVDLRDRLDEAGASFRVVKNTLTERAADEAGVEPLKPFLVGPTALAFVRGDAALAAKVLAAFRRESQLLEFKGGTLNGDALSVEQVESIARLPAREVLQGQFVGVLASPVTGLVRGLGGLLGGLAVALGQIQEQGLVGGNAPSAPAPEAAADAAPAEEPAPSEAPGDPVAEAVAAEETSEEAPAEETAPSEAPGDPVAEAVAAEETSEEAPAEGGSDQTEAPAEGAEQNSEEN